jgi:hypothetical protein
MFGIGFGSVAPACSEGPEAMDEGPGLLGEPRAVFRSGGAAVSVISTKRSAPRDRPNAVLTASNARLSGE